MGIHGIFKEIGPGQRVSLAKLSADHFVSQSRPLRLAIDISIWLFQIQAGKGGSNPALRTFYYRLLRLLTLNIHPLFVFDGPNKPLFKRNKKVGGPGVRVASVPEFLAKQLLKQFGFPWHVAPGEAEAECALLQQESIVDAVLSEDVDTLMFGSGVTLKNWSAENTSKTPTHVNVYRAEETKEKSGMDREGMILVALMSGGDYITEGIPGCGPKLACDAARAGFGRDLCAIRKKDTAGFAAWRDRLQHQIRTNEQKIFSRKNTKLTIPDDFPNLEVLGYYTQPCVSTAEKLSRLRETVKWDQEIDFAALRSFTADAFDWRYLGGAKKFIRNLAPAMLVRELRLQGAPLSEEAQETKEKHFVSAIHGKRNHGSTDGQVEYRISFIPMNLVAIDLTIEDEDDDFIPAGGADDQSDAESEFAALPSSTADEDEPVSPSRRRVAKPYDPNQPEKLWMMPSFLKTGCPMLVEEYENSLKDPKEFFKQRRRARAAATTAGNLHTKKATRKKGAEDVQAGAILQYGTITKSSRLGSYEPSSSQEIRKPLQNIANGPNARTGAAKAPSAKVETGNAFKLPSTQIPLALQQELDAASDDDTETPKIVRHGPSSKTSTGLFAPFAIKKTEASNERSTPRGRKRLSEEAVSPAMSQQTIDSYWSPSPRKLPSRPNGIINLVSSSPAKEDRTRAGTPTPVPPRHRFIRDSGLENNDHEDFSPILPDSVTKRRKRGSLKRCRTAPPQVADDTEAQAFSPIMRASTPEAASTETVEAMDLASPPPIRGTVPREPNLTSSMLFSVGPSVVQPNDAPKPHPSRPVRSDLTDTASPLESSNPRLEAIKPSASGAQTRRSPGQQRAKKKRIQLRQSLAGAWKETEVEELDLSGDGGGWTQSQGRARLPTWRKSSVEVLDLTGA